MSKRSIHRKDGNHDSIVNELRIEPKVSVSSTVTAGGGFPDMVVGLPGLTILGTPTHIRMLLDVINEARIPGLKIHNGVNLLIELKDGNATNRQQQLRDNQERWHDLWQGQKAVCKTADEVRNLCNLTKIKRSQHLCPNEARERLKRGF